MSVNIARLTARAPVVGAIEEFDRLGRSRFLATYGYHEARTFFVDFNGNRYASKAIAGVAFRNQYQLAESVPWVDAARTR